jgi:hypothetical protein
MSEPDDPADFDRDPAALAWARTRIEQYVTRLADFEQQCAAKGDEAGVRCFQIVQRHISHYFLGDGGCTIGAFDERRPRLEWLRRDAGPTVREAAAADRRWPLEKTGE